MKKNTYLILSLIALLGLVSCSNTETTTTKTTTNSWTSQNQPPMMWSWARMWWWMWIDKSSDTKLQTMITDVKDKFKVLTYTDKKTWKTISYNLYTPENYDSSKSYPMVMFIWDSSTVSDDVSKPLTQWWGWLIWATAEEQKKHPSFVLVPQYPNWTQVIWDSSNSEYVDLTKRLIDEVISKNNIDTKRIYTTGQSMWCMISLYLSAHYPDLFAWELFVSGQRPIDELKNINSQNFIYIVSMWDQKASTGQKEVRDMFDTNNYKYWVLDDLDAQSEDNLSSSVNKILQENNKNNFFTFKYWTTLASGQSMPGWAWEHMTSFDYAYKISALRDWLFAQSK